MSLYSTTTEDQLSLEAAVGQVLCCGWSGEDACSVNWHARVLVDELRVGGVVLLGRNVRSAVQVRTMLAELQRRSLLPLLVSIDHEGGRVHRFRRTLTHFPGNMALGAIADPQLRADLAYRQAVVQGMELRALGINWNFAPCLDVNCNPDNPIIGTRSYGEDPHMVAELGAITIRGYEAAGVLSCAKHFPGHGDTAIDSHLGLPTVSAHWDRLEAVELAPFRRAIEAGVPAIMTSHILFPALDPSYAATLSPAVLHGLLRDRMGYRGLVITDCLEMAAISETIGTPQGAVQALVAGADMVLVCHTVEVQRETYRAIRNAVMAGILPESRLREAVARICHVKRRYAAGRSAAQRGWPRAEHSAVAAAIANASVTAYRNAGSVPFPEGAKVCVLSAHSSARVLAHVLRASGFRAFAATLRRDHGVVGAVDLTARVLDADRIVVLTGPPGPAQDALRLPEQAAVVRRLHAMAGDRLVVVATDTPYDIRLFPEVGTYLCTFCAESHSLVALKEVLRGSLPALGRMPVRIPGVAASQPVLPR